MEELQTPSALKQKWHLWKVLEESTEKGRKHFPAVGSQCSRFLCFSDAAETGLGVAGVSSKNSHLLVVIWSSSGLLGPASSCEAWRRCRCADLKDPLSLLLVPVSSFGMSCGWTPQGKWAAGAVPWRSALQLTHGQSPWFLWLLLGSWIGRGAQLEVRQDGAWCSAVLQLFITTASNLQHWNNIIRDLDSDCVLITLLFTYSKWEVERKRRIVRSAFQSWTDRSMFLQGYSSLQQLPLAYGRDDDLSVTHWTLFTLSNDQKKRGGGGGEHNFNDLIFNHRLLSHL